MKRIFHFLLCLTLVFSLITPFNAYAEATWPDYVPIQAEGGIVMDADTGTVLYGKNIHTAYYPASITKIMTALVVIENCSLDEMVTFSHNAVYNVEAGSSSAGLDEGDVLNVRDCLYALLLKSANESANALAEHVAGSTEAFAEMMNAKAASLGCQDSHFANPSGLNNPDHYVSAYDVKEKYAGILRGLYRRQDRIHVSGWQYPGNLCPQKWHDPGIRGLKRPPDPVHRHQSPVRLWFPEFPDSLRRRLRHHLPVRNQ